MENTKRIEWIDFLRAIAILAVVLCHATEFVYPMNLDYVGTISCQSEIFLFFVFTLSRLGVPFFLMITGYLLLDREYNEERTKKFWRKNWLHLLICTEIWFLIYEIYLKVFIDEDISFPKMLADLLFLHKIDMKQVWYLPVILGIYILIPFVANALRTFREKWLIFPAIFYLIYISGTPLVNVVSNIYMDQPVSLQLSLGFSGGMYGMYVILGYMIKKGMFKQIRSVFLIIAAIICIIAGTGFQIWTYSQKYSYNIWYDSPFIYIASVSLFELGSRIRKVPCYNLVRGLSKYSFAIYLVHVMVLMPVVQKIAELQFVQPGKVGILWLLGVILTFVFVWIIQKIPKIGKYILYIK